MIHRGWLLSGGEVSHRTGINILLNCPDRGIAFMGDAKASCTPGMTVSSRYMCRNIKVEADKGRVADAEKGGECVTYGHVLAWGTAVVSTWQECKTSLLNVPVLPSGPYLK